MSVVAPPDPLLLPLPPLVVGRYRTPDRRAEVALRSSVWLDGAWWACLDRTYAAGMGFLAPHRHARTDEVHFVRDGTVRYLLRGRLRTAGPGDVIVVPAGTLHADPWATGDGPATITSLLSPAGPEWIRFGADIGRVTTAGRVNRQGHPPVPLLFDIVHRSGADVLVPGLPAGLQRRLLIPVLAAIGRLLWRDA